MTRENCDNGTELRRLALRNQAILRSSMDGFFVVDRECRFLEVNDAFCRMIGYDADELLALRITDLEASSDSRNGAASHTQTGLHHFASAHRHKLGHLVHLEISINVLQDEGRKILVGFARDVTERNRAAAELARLSRQQRMILDAVDDGIVGLDRDGRVTFVNPATARLLAASPGRLIGRNAHEALWRDGMTCARAECPICRVLADQARRDAGESEFTRQDGVRFPVELSVSAIHDGAVLSGAVLAFKDLTQRRRAEEERAALERQMQQSQRMESLGLLAGGIAHDLNNMLVGILGNVSLAAAQLHDEEELRKRLARISDASQRATKVIGQILAYSGQVRCETELLDLNDLIRNMTEFMRAGVPRHIAIDIEPCAEPLAASADSGQIQQVLTNLIVNAAEAIGERPGTIRVTTERVALDAQQRARRFPGQTLRGDEFAAFVVADDGCGMSGDTLARIFDPFFSTKGAGRGLGLAAMRGMIKAHGGGVHVSSRTGEGTRFTVVLPLSTEPVRTVRKAHPESATLPAGTALVIDDEFDVRDVVQFMLEQRGWSVLSAADGAEGLRIHTERGDEIDAVLLDMTMPGKSGADVYRELRARRPGVPIVVMSGYSERSIPAQLAEHGPVVFLPKPFTDETLASKLAQCRGSRPTPLTVTAES